MYYSFGGLEEIIIRASTGNLSRCDRKPDGQILSKSVMYGGLLDRFEGRNEDGLGGLK